MRKLLTFALFTLLGIALGASGAFAAWKLSAASGSTASAKALSMPAMAAPSASATNSTVTVSFPATTLSNGASVTGYAVKRYDPTNLATDISASCTGTITLTCTDANRPNGTYNYSITALRSNWKGAESPKKAVVVSAAPPVVSISHPTNGAVYNATTWANACANRICGTATSATGVADVKISLRAPSGNYYDTNGNFLSPTEVLFPVSGTTNWTFGWFASGFQVDGNYTIRVVATDLAGNAGSSSSTFMSDRSGPSTGSFGFGFVKNGATISVSSAADTASGVAGVTYLLCTDNTCSTVLQNLGTSTTPTTYPLTWNSQPVDGRYWLRGIVADNAGNTTTLNATVDVDNTGPSTTDNASSTWTNSAQTVTFTRNDGTGVGGGTTYYTTNGATPTTSSPSGNSVTLSIPGVYTIKYFSVDALGNVGPTKTAANQVRIDQTIPLQPTITSPTNHSWVKNGVALTATAADNNSAGFSSGIESVSYYCAGGACGEGFGTLIGTSTTAPYSVVWNGQPTNGNYILMAHAKDAAGNVNFQSYNINVDNTVPVTTDNTSVIGNGWKSTNQTVTLTRSDAGASGGMTTYYTTDGSTPSTSSAQGTSVSLTADGVYTIKYFTVDAAGNTETAKTGTTQIRIDKNAPSSATITSPTGAWIKTGGTLTATGVDSGSGVVSMSYFYCNTSGCTPNQLIGSSTVGPNFPVNFTQANPTVSNRVVARAFDALGRSVDSGVVTLNVDNTGPTNFSLTAPADGATLIGSVNVSAAPSASGASIAEVKFQRSPSGANTWTDIGTDNSPSSGSYSVSWVTTGVTDGDYDLRAIATDTAGNLTTSSVRNVEIANDFKVTDLELVNGNGNGNSGRGRVELNDRINVTFSHAMKVNSFCSLWSINGDGVDQNLNNNSYGVTATLNNNAGTTGNDTLTLSSNVCTINFGAIDLGSAGYVTGGNATFSGTDQQTRTEITWDVSSRTLSILLGQKGGGGTIPNTGITASVAAYIPSSQLKRASDLAVITAGFTTGSIRQF